MMQSPSKQYCRECEQNVKTFACFCKPCGDTALCSEEALFSLRKVLKNHVFSKMMLIGASFGSIAFSLLVFYLTMMMGASTWKTEVVIWTIIMGGLPASAFFLHRSMLKSLFCHTFLTTVRGFLAMYMALATTFLFSVCMTAETFRPLRADSFMITSISLLGMVAEWSVAYGLFRYHCLVDSG